MCNYIGAKVILAYLLSYQERQSVTQSEISEYCKNVYIALRKNNKNEYAYFDISSDAISKAIEANSDYYEMYYDSVYLKKEVDIDSINKNISIYLKQALEQAAKQTTIAVAKV